jgi:hypothetical protein
MPKISQLPAASSVGSADLFAIVQSSVTKKATASLVLSYVQTALALGTAAFVNVPIVPANGGTGVISPTIHTLPVAQGASNFNFLGPLTNGQFLIGSTGSDPVPANLVAGTNVTISNSAGSVTISAAGLGGFSWHVVSGTTQLMVANNGYIANNGALVTLTLPASSNVGDEIDIIGKGAGGWLAQCGGGQTIVVGNTSTSAGGSVASTDANDAFYMICTVANTEWRVGSGPQSAGLTIV